MAEAAIALERDMRSSGEEEEEQQQQQQQPAPSAAEAHARHLGDLSARVAAGCAALDGVASDTAATQAEVLALARAVKAMRAKMAKREAALAAQAEALAARESAIGAREEAFEREELDARAARERAADVAASTALAARERELAAGELALAEANRVLSHKQDEVVDLFVDLDKAEQRAARKDAALAEQEAALDKRSAALADKDTALARIERRLLKHALKVTEDEKRARSLELNIEARERALEVAQGVVRLDRESIADRFDEAVARLREVRCWAWLLAFWKVG